MALLQLDLRLIAIGVVIIALGLLLMSSRAPRITRDGKPLRNPPNTLPLVGNGILFLQARQKLFTWFTHCIHQTGPETLSITVPSLPPGVIISSPANLDYVFRNESIFQKGHFFTHRSYDLFGSGIINVDGELWKLQRRAGLQFLNRDNLRVLTEVALPRVVRESMRCLEREGEEGRVVDLQEVLHEITTQVMGKMAYDMEMHVHDDFTKAFEYASGATAERFQNPLWQITELFTPGGFKLRRSLAIVRSQGKQIVSKAVAVREGGVKEQHKAVSNGDIDQVSGSLIQSLLDSIGDEKLVADSALNYLSAGRDTVAQALTWTFYLLMRHPQVFQKLRQAVLGAQDSSISMDELLRPQRLSPTNMPYVLAVFYETLRLYPPIPFEIKQAQQDTTLPDGTFLPATSVIVWCPWAMGRSFDIWGSDACDYRPERWLSNDGQVQLRSAAEFPVFNGGQRLCLGKKMAEEIAVQVIAVFVSKFDFKPAYEGERESVSSLTLPMRDGLPVHVRSR
ncbi:cytochrome P450 [Sarocladium strictum]